MSYQQPDPPSGDPWGQQPPPSPHGGQQQPYGQQPGYGQPYGQQPYAFPVAPPTHGSATTSMVLGIISVALAVLAVFCLVTGPFAVLPGPFAIWLGLKARREIEAEPQRYGGSGQALTGLICGIIGTLLGLLMVAAVVIFFVFIGWSFNEASMT